MKKKSKNNFSNLDIICFESPVLKDSDIGKGWSFKDFRNNKFVTPDQPHFGKCYLELGDEP